MNATDTWGYQCEGALCRPVQMQYRCKQSNRSRVVLCGAAAKSPLTAWRTHSLNGIDCARWVEAGVGNEYGIVHGCAGLGLAQPG